VKIRRTLAAGAGAAAVLGPVSYLLFFRRRCLTWGTSGDEVVAKLPGDELLPGAGLVTTRATTIDAPPEAIWPWLAQMGSGRGGAYTYDWIENLLRLNMHSASEILPEYQDIKAGDELPLGSGGPVMRVEVLDPPRALAIRTRDQNWVWIFALLPDGESTRLISRNRIATEALAPASRLFYLLFMEPGSLVMERKMLLGIKHRAEDTARQAARLSSQSIAMKEAGQPSLSRSRSVRDLSQYRPPRPHATLGGKNPRQGSMRCHFRSITQGWKYCRSTPACHCWPRSRSDGSVSSRAARSSCCR
jgi:hypothetical protein